MKLWIPTLLGTGNILIRKLNYNNRIDCILNEERVT